MPLSDSAPDLDRAPSLQLRPGATGRHGARVGMSRGCRGIPRDAYRVYGTPIQPRQLAATLPRYRPHGRPAPFMSGPAGCGRSKWSSAARRAARNRSNTPAARASMAMATEAASDAPHASHVGSASARSGARCARPRAHSIQTSGSGWSAIRKGSAARARKALGRRRTAKACRQPWQKLQ